MQYPVKLQQLFYFSATIFPDAFYSCVTVNVTANVTVFFTANYV